MAGQDRHSTGIETLDEMLGGGLLPGTLTVIVGATGIGKTQLGIQFANAGLTQEGRRGVVFDMSARGDSQSHSEYAARLFNWKMSKVSGDQTIKLDAFFADDRNHGDYLHVFDYSGRRVTKRDLDFDQWQAWQAELNAKLRSAIAFLYGNGVQGTRRFVVDGIEPTDRPHESIQFNLFEYVYHQVIRKEPAWVARDLFREAYRRNADNVANRAYDAADNSCVLLYTSHDALLDDMIERPLDEGDALANANTLIYLGKIREGNRIERGLYIAKHRGSACDDQIARYRINDAGLQVVQPGNKGQVPPATLPATAASGSPDSVEFSRTTRKIAAIRLRTVPMTFQGTIRPGGHDVTNIHPTAVVSGNAELGVNVSIGPFSVVEAGAILHDDCQLASHVVVKSGTTLGVNCQVSEGAVLGGRPQHMQAGNEVGRVEVGDHNVIREYVTIHRALKPDDVTQLGHQNLLMANSHVGHDSVLGHNIIVTNNVMIAGHVAVDDRVYLGGAAGIHQFCRIGQYAMVGGQAHISQDVPPFVMVDGVSTKIVGLNKVGLRRGGFSTEELADLKAAYRILYRAGLTWEETLAKLATEFPGGPAADFYEFLMHSQRGVVQERRTPRAASIQLATRQTPAADPPRLRKAS